jgi:thioredoxin-like negative regulator of GroEL
MIERLIFILFLAVVGVIAYRVCVSYQIKRAMLVAPVDPLLMHWRRGVPAIVYFTTPNCAPCRLQQTPTLQKLEAEFGEALSVIRVDATANPDAADRWQVFSVPTTFILDKDGQPRKVFNGVVDGETLIRELKDI